jgi:hypothetical protein
MFLRIFKHLLPNARAWQLTINKRLREFFEGLTDLGNDSKTFFDEIWLDIFPETTRELDKWENQWGLSNTIVNEQDRRNRLDATWKALGGQSPRYIQDTLQASGFDVYLHKWWVPGTEPAIGVNTCVIARNPADFINDGAQPLEYDANDGGINMEDGDPNTAQDGSTIQPTAYLLVNKVFVPSLSVIGDAFITMIDGGTSAQDGGGINIYELKQYVIPVDTDKHHYFMYIGGQTFPEPAIIEASRRNEFETLCLKICPTQQWLGIIVNYS